MLRRLAPIALALLFIVGLAPSALAGGSGTQPATTVSGDDITVVGTGFTPGETVNFSIQDTSYTCSSVANAEGAATCTFTEVPAGSYAVNVLGVSSNNTQSFAGVTVQAATDSGSGTGSDALADTGSESLPLARVGIVLLAAGAVAVYAGQKRRTAMTINA
jgi:hypothetical protein